VSGYRHHALFFDAPQTLVAAAAPFLRAGLAVGDVPVLVCRDRNNALLAEALGADAAAEVMVLEPAGVYTRVVDAVEIYQRLVQAQRRRGARRVRLVGEVDFGPPGMGDEWTRFEAVVNMALAPYPLSSVCAYDTRSLPDPILDAARTTHPNLLTPAGPTGNSDYRDPATVLRALPADPPDPVEATPPQFTVELTTPAELAGLRRGLRAALTDAGIATRAIDELVVAVHEVAANGLIHGDPPVAVRAWISGDRARCTVTDRGHGHDLPLAGYLPPTAASARGRAGLWVARHTVDRLSNARTPGGFTVSLTTTRGSLPS
jgi:anti-sigma regulatory factor (Ser/Thr protein kinase)